MAAPLLGFQQSTGPPHRSAYGLDLFRLQTRQEQQEQIEQFRASPTALVTDLASLRIGRSSGNSS